MTRCVLAAVMIIASWVAGAALLPSGIPFGVVLHGLTLGAVSSMTALGLVLIYRFNRIINLAQAEIGGLAATVSVLLVAGWGVPYLAVLPVGVAVAMATGWLVQATVVRRFFSAPRLVLMVATLGVAQILGAAQLALPSLFGRLDELSSFSSGLGFETRVGPLIFGGDHLLAALGASIALVGLGWFLHTSRNGVAVRAVADSTERARLLGIPVERLSMITWVTAAALSGLAAMLSAPLTGPELGAGSGVTTLLAPLAAAVVGRMERVGTTVVAALSIGVFQQVVLWNHPRSSVGDVALFVLVMAALLLQHRRARRVDDGDLGGYVAVAEVRPVPERLRSLPEVRGARAIGTAVLAAALIGLPFVASESTTTLASYVAINGIIGVSLVVLTGWAGQISLGQFALAGVGAATTAALLVERDVELLLALPASMLVGGLVAVLVGLPALRIPGPFLAVTTLAFGVAVSTYVLNASNFPALAPARVERPWLLDRIDLGSSGAFYGTCLAALALVVRSARNYRRSRAGRASIAVRDNERGAASFSIHPVRTKLTAFALSGALAGLGGALYVIALRGMPFSGFNPTGSVVVFTAVVIGGVASLPGALLGVVYVEVTTYFLRGAAQLLATGAGLLVLLMVVPGGLGGMVTSLRDRFLVGVARRRGLDPGGLDRSPDDETDGRDRPAPSERPAASVRPGGEGTAGGTAVRCTSVQASYGQVRVLHDVDLAVGRGEIVALVGTNGAGKSTLLRVIAGLQDAGHGRVEVDGHDLDGLDAAARVARGVVTVPGGRGVFGSLTVAENLRLGAWLAADDPEFLAATHRRIDALFPSLSRRSGELAASLSSGEQQMLTIAQALLCRPRVLMIDELSLGLSPAVVAELLDVVRSISDDGVTVIVVEQSLRVAAALADRAVFMEKGQVRFSGPTSELLERPDLARSVFLGTAEPVVAPVSGAGPTADEVGARPALRVHDLSCSFGGVTALRSVDLEVRRGEVLGIIGSNGAGKTTLVDLCSGFVPDQHGRIELDGIDITAWSAASRAQAGLGRMFADARLFPSMTVAETVATALDRHVEVRDPLACALGLARDSEVDVDERVAALLTSTGLTDHRDATVAELSTGTRRIVELACAMAHRPSVLLLDEPSSGIAQRETEALATALRRLRAELDATFVVIEHDISLLRSIADRLVCLHLGSVIADGPTEAVLSDPAVVSSYLGSNDVTIERSDRIPS